MEMVQGRATRSNVSRNNGNPYSRHNVNKKAREVLPPMEILLKNVTSPKKKSSRATKVVDPKMPSWLASPSFTFAIRSPEELHSDFEEWRNNVGKECEPFDEDEEEISIDKELEKLPEENVLLPSIKTLEPLPRPSKRSKKESGAFDVDFFNFIMEILLRNKDGKSGSSTCTSDLGIGNKNTVEVFTQTNENVDSLKWSNTCEKFTQTLDEGEFVVIFRRPLPLQTDQRYETFKRLKGPPDTGNSRDTSGSFGGDKISRGDSKKTLPVID